MSIRRQSAAAPKTLVFRAQPATPAPSIHPIAQNARSNMVQFPSLALLSQAPRSVVGAPMQPGTAERGAFANPNNLETLMPFIIVALHKASRKGSYKTLCAEITNLLATNSQLNQPSAWHLVLKELRMPLITVNTGAYTNQPVQPDGVGYYRRLFQYYCSELSDTSIFSDTGIFSWPYPAFTILTGWQERIVNHGIWYGDSYKNWEERMPTASPAQIQESKAALDYAFREAVSAWVWVANNYVPFVPKGKGNATFDKFVTKLVTGVSAPAWTYFIDSAWRDTRVALDPFNLSLISRLLEQRDSNMERGAGWITAHDLTNRTFEFVISRVPPPKLGTFVVNLSQHMARRHLDQLRENKQLFNEDDVSLFYSQLIKPIMTNRCEMYLRYEDILEEIGIAVATYIHFKNLAKISDLSRQAFNVEVFNLRTFLMSAFPVGKCSFVGNYERLMKDENQKIWIRGLLDEVRTVCHLPANVLFNLSPVLLRWFCALYQETQEPGWWSYLAWPKYIYMKKKIYIID